MVKCLVKIQTKRSIHLRMVNHCNKEVCVRLLRHGSKITARRAGKFTFILLKPFFLPIHSTHSSVCYANSGLLEKNCTVNNNVPSSTAEKKDKLLTGVKLQIGMNEMKLE